MSTEESLVGASANASTASNGQRLPSGVVTEALESRLQAMKLKSSIDTLAQITGMNEHGQSRRSATTIPSVTSASGEQKQIGSSDDGDDVDEEEKEEEQDEGDDVVPTEEGTFTGVKLGYLEKPSNLLTLRRDYFPSKVGGMPAWLDPLQLPSSDTLTCTNCDQPLIFLLQVYAPIDRISHAFHRSVYVFVCSNGRCVLQHKQARVIRSQLPRQNKYYSFQPPLSAGEMFKKLSIDEQFTPEYYPHPEATLCRVCGLPGSKRCTSCKGITYCSRSHQLADWPAHKFECKHLASTSNIPTTTSTTTTTLESNSSATISIPPVPLTTAQKTQIAVHRRKLLMNPMELCIEDEYLYADEVDDAVAHAKGLITKYEKEREGLDPAELAKRDKELAVELGEIEPEKDDETDEKADEDDEEGASDKGEEINSKTSGVSSDASNSNSSNNSNSTNNTKANNMNSQLQQQQQPRENIDPIFVAFQSRVAYNPDQVLRFIPPSRRIAAQQDGATRTQIKEASPLWVGKGGSLSRQWKAPKCDHCGGERDFEFQVLPQILYHVEKQGGTLLAGNGHTNSSNSTPTSANKQPTNSTSNTKSTDTEHVTLDFATLAIYTCRNSCGDQGGYYEEYIHIQPPHL